MLSHCTLWHNVYNDKYMMEEGPTQMSETLLITTKIANMVLHIFELVNFQGYISFLKWGDPFDCGDKVELHDFFHFLYTN